MSGIDRLRTLAGAWDEWGLGGALAEIADQIERERAEDCYRMGLDCGTVWRVVADMERHCLGHEGMEDSPVDRWARELRDALKSDTSDERGAQNPSWHDHAETADVTSEAQKVTRDPAEDVSMSAYDLLSSDEREAIAWVREHGGIEAVKEEWNHSRNLKRSLEKAQAKVERQQRHIEFVQRKCRERVKRPAVPASDGEPLEQGQTVWDTDAETDTPLTVVEVSSDLVRCEYTWKDGKTYRPCYPPDQLTHQRPDTWQRIEEDAGCTATKYNERRGTIFTTKQQVARDLVRRCKALAERGE